MSKSSYHVVRLGTGWSVKRNKFILSSHDTQEEARKNAVMRAKRVKADIVIYSRDGKICSVESYDGSPSIQQR